MKDSDRFIHVLGESVGSVLALSVATGAVWYSIKYLIIKTLKLIGIDYFAELKASYEWMGKTIIESRAILNADRTCFYRLYNGEPYMRTTMPVYRNLKIESGINVTKNRGVAKLPDALDDRFYELFQLIAENHEFCELFATDSSISDRLRNELYKLDIQGFIAIKIRDEYALYGVVLYTWHHVSHMPRQLLPKYGEHLQSVKSIILDETKFMMSRTIKNRIKEIISSIINRIRRKK